MNIRSKKNAKERREDLEKERGVNLKNTGSFTLDESVAGTRNCENMIGSVQIPLGIAGPLRITGVHPGQAQEYYLPLATTEGALVASVSRGCKAITESGGASVLVERKGATRGPVFKVKNLDENSRLFDFIESHRDEFDRIAKSTSGHIGLFDIYTQSTGLYRFVRFAFDTQDAMGLNMVTIATEEIARYIEEQTGAVCTSLSGNYCVDKKASWLNVAHNRGFEVWAEVVIKKEILDRVLKTTAEKVVSVWLSKCMIGSAMSGSMGFNAQFANVVAALFIATGQDPAHVVEGSVGMTTAETAGNGALYMSIYLPGLMAGTVGGGTGLSTQREALSILGVAGGNNGKNAEHFAGIVGAAVLAGEVSLLSSLSEGTLAKAHKKLGRGGA